MDEKKKKQLIHYLEEFVKLNKQFFDIQDFILKEYWKGQVMGLCKAIDLLVPGEIDTKCYLDQLI